MRIRTLREERNLHQKEVAAVLGISQPAYSDLENGHTMFTAIALDKLADFYEMGLDELLRQNGATLNMYQWCPGKVENGSCPRWEGLISGDVGCRC